MERHEQSLGEADGLIRLDPPFRNLFEFTLELLLGQRDQLETDVF